VDVAGMANFKGLWVLQTSSLVPVISQRVKVPCSFLGAFAIQWSAH
jgi:hypothetical protein